MASLIPRMACATALALCWMSGARADSVTDESEYEKRIGAAQTIGAQGADLLGDDINLYSGALSFAATDVSIPGNNGLPVAVGRTFAVGAKRSGDGHFGDWDMDIPHIHGVYAESDGWIVTDPDSPNRFNRCSGFDAPPVAAGDSPTNGYFVPYEFWHGVYLASQGGGDQEVLANQTTTWQPTDGETYPLVTTARWRLRCISADTRTGEQGEGFLALAPDGTKYQLDWIVYRNESRVFKSQSEPAPFSGNDPDTPILGSFALSRREYWALPTKVTDRFGNTVTYTYDTTVGGDRWRLLQIQSSDNAGTPRTLTLTYWPSSHRIATVSDGTNTWTYNYGSGFNLSEVILPDASKWRFVLGGLNAANLNYTASNPLTCTKTGAGTYRAGTFSAPTSVNGTITHPSGATGTFVLEARHHGRSFMPARANNCIVYNPTDPRGFERDPEVFDTWSITSKTIEGPGIASGSLAWTYAYSAPANNATGDACGASCSRTKTVTVTEPEGHQTIHTFGTKYQEDEGKLVQLDVIDMTDNVPTNVRTVSYHHRQPTGSPTYPAVVGVSYRESGDTYMATRLFPQDQRQIMQQGETFTWSATAFDVYAQPTTVTRTSSLGHSRTETTLYENNTTRWVLSQVKKVTEGSGIVMRENTYDPLTANRLTAQEFGRPIVSMAYYPDGTLSTRTDAASHQTAYSDYFRGVARHVVLPDFSTVDLEVNALGHILSVTNPAAAKTEYRYDALGRMARIIYPTGDPVLWADKTFTFTPITSAEYGLPSGHWKQVVSTGAGRTERYFDALWRPVLTRSYTTSNLAGTERIIQRRFDSHGRERSVSYPVRTIASYNATVNDTVTRFDALGRPVDIEADWEGSGTLIKRYEYLNDFTTRVTNPRLKQTSTTFQAFDNPDDALALEITAPLSTKSTLTRDVFGKVKTMKRSGTFNGSPIEATRTYVYDAQQRLCKTMEPESGSTVLDYNTIGLLAWKAAGQTLTSTTDCQRGSVPTTQRESYDYDTADRLWHTSYQDGVTPTVTRTYTDDGLLHTLSTDGITWTTAYNRRRLVDSETLTVDSASYALGYTYATTGHVATMSYPDGSVLDYAPNALGEATKVGTYASAVTTWPNGALNTFRYGDNTLHTTTQNERGLPEQSSDGSLLNDTYAYDENGNVTGITDNALGQFSRALVYDDLDRLSTATNAGIWGGTASYTYDGLDNVRRSVTPQLDLTLQYDGQQRVNRLVTTTNPTQSLIDYTYNARGSMVSRNLPTVPQTFTTDLGERVRSITSGGSPVATYRYDGYGRRTVVSKGGTQLLQMYSPGGQLLFQTSGGATDTIFQNGFEGPVDGTKRFVYLGRHLIAEDGSGGRRYIYTDALGSPVVKVGPTTDRTYYYPFGLVFSGGGPGPGFAGHVLDAETGLNYMQARFFDPYLGRFVSTDPVSADTDSFNRYAYARNNPYRNIDPDGRVALELVEAGFWADVATPEPTDAAWPKWVGWVALGASAAAVDYVILDTVGDFSPGPISNDAGMFSPTFVTVPTAWPSPGYMESSTLVPGPFAGDSIPARGPGRDFTPGEREEIDRIGTTTGCHTCGTTNPGTSSGHFVPDHQPPSGTNADDKPQELYPHCLACSRRQGGETRQNQRKPPPPEEKPNNDEQQRLD